MGFDRVVKILSRFIPTPRLKEHLYVEWKNKVLILMLGAFVIIGPIAFIPGIAISIHEGVWGLVITDIIVYSLLLFVAFSKKLSSNTKVIVSIATFLLLSVAVFLQIGTRGSGFNWMFIFVLLACFFYGYKGLIYSELISLLTLLLLAIPIMIDSPYTMELNHYGKSGWLVNIILFITTSFFFSILLVEILQNLSRSIKKEKEISTLLLENQFKLREQRNRAEEADRLKSEFLANMSHEIRTPMNALLGFSNMLGEPGLDKATLEHYREVVNVSGEQLVRLIDDIIDVSKIESNQMKLELSEVDITLALLEVVEVSRNKIETLKSRLELNYSLPDGLKPVRTITDEIRLKQIVTNLIDNAIKYSESGTIEVGCKVIENVTPATIEVYVKDEGKGIPEDELKTIFDRFSQASNIDFKKGAGLGLSIVKGLLDMLEGRIWVESEENKGSKFTFSLPLKDVDLNRLQTQDDDIDPEIPHWAGKNIWIAEDDLSSYLLLKQIIQKTGAHVERAENGQVLLEKLEHKLPDLVLLDINMPVMNGFDAMIEIRKKYGDLPVIAQTAYAMLEEKQRCLEAGCDDYIPKPIKEPDLIEKIKLYL